MKPIKLQFSYKCDQHWESMTKLGDGRFCERCSRTIIDFSVMSDSEIINYLKTHKEICGKLNFSQLNRTLVQPLPSKMNWGIRWASFIMAAFASISTMAQNASQNLSSENVIDQNTDFKSDQNGRPENFIAETEFVTIKGYVVYGYSGKPVRHAEITIDSTQIITADKLGRFEIRIKKTDLLNKGFIMATWKEYYGYAELNTEQVNEEIIVRIYDGAIGWVVNPLLYLEEE